MEQRESAEREGERETESMRKGANMKSDERVKCTFECACVFMRVESGGGDKEQIVRYVSCLALLDISPTSENVSYYFYFPSFSSYFCKSVDTLRHIIGCENHP